MRESMSFPTVSSKPVRYDAPFGSPASLHGTVDPRGVFFFAPGSFPQQARSESSFDSTTTVVF